MAVEFLAKCFKMSTVAALIVSISLHAMLFFLALDLSEASREGGKSSRHLSVRIRTPSKHKNLPTLPSLQQLAREEHSSSSPSPLGGEGFRVRSNEFSDIVSQTVRYPARAQELGLEGVVKYKAFFDEEGKLTHAEIIKSVHPILDEAVLASLQKVHWLSGSVVESEVSFELE